MRGGAGGAQPHLAQPLGVGDDAQAALLADDHEVRAHPGLDLVCGAIVAADLLVGDQLQAQRVRQRPGQLPEHVGHDHRRDLHVLRAAAVEPVAVAAGLVGFGGHDVEVGVEQDPEHRARAGRPDQRAGLAARGEAFHREVRADDVEHQIERPGQLLGAVRSGRHGDQLGGLGDQIHAADPTRHPRNSVAGNSGGG
nr:hypothetical protein GCM10020092_055010 [Actinoplanes digitatis]